MRINNDNNIVDLPMILIDDEADNASIDLGQDQKLKRKINHQKIKNHFYILRKILVIMMPLE